jgi:hypothetical protein
MKRSWSLRLVVVLGLFSFLPYASPAHAQQAKRIGTVSALEGKATVLHQGKFTPEPLAIHQPIFPEDIIETDVGSKIRLTLIDATAVMLGERSRVVIDRFVYAPQQQTLTARLTVLSGIFRAIIKELLPQSTFEVTTPTAIAAIRGTDLMGEVRAESTAIVVLEGTVVVSNVRPRFRGLTTLTPGTGTTVLTDQPPSAPTRWSESRIEALRRATALQ